MLIVIASTAAKVSGSPATDVIAYRHTAPERAQSDIRETVLKGWECAGDLLSANAVNATRTGGATT